MMIIYLQWLNAGDTMLLLAAPIPIYQGTNTIGGNDFAIVQFNASDLSLVRVNNPGGTGSDSFKSVIESGNYYIAVGYSNSDLSGFTGGMTGQGGDDFLLVKYGE